MAQTKDQKRQKALNSLESRIQAECENRARLQTQQFEYVLIPPSDYEFGLYVEYNSLKRVMNLDYQNQPNPF